jgi:Kef-type K+ transport system membrane component KefB
MSHLPELISDLAFILITAGITTIIFKRLGQPLVLGYIVAGFLAGPHMPYTPTVSDTGSIQTWADIGVIFLMFTLGLEFSFKKILRMGQRPIVAALLIIFFMLSIGSATGHLFGWGRMDSLFLGGMLAMSSTTIIYKAFDDLGLRTQKFAGEVLSVLIIEDILGIVLMVILSAMAVSRDFEGGQMLFSMLKLAFFLILWFIVGVYLVPTLLRKGGRWMNSETLVVVAVGLCFAMVVIASAVGYSSAFGAFMMGSILAETMEAESIERVVDPLKNLFGAIFFVSVGMLVDPDILVAYWQPIAVITLVIIAGQSRLHALRATTEGGDAMWLFHGADWGICLYHSLVGDHPRSHRQFPLPCRRCRIHHHHLPHAVYDTRRGTGVSVSVPLSPRRTDTRPETPELQEGRHRTCATHRLAGAAQCSHPASGRIPYAIHRSHLSGIRSPAPHLPRHHGKHHWRHRLRPPYPRHGISLPTRRSDA